jgi:predicted phosphodiesterase
MSKYNVYNNDIIPHLEDNSNNSSIAKILFPNGTAAEIDRLRKHVANIRIFGLPISEREVIKEAKERNSLALEVYQGGNPDNILVIGDLHAPFTLPKYLQFCREQQEIHDCGTVIFIGDIIDNHFSSYHESDPDGYSAGEELDRAIDMISDWYHTFPKATVIIGNHDRLVYRKAYSSGVSKKWIREYKDVLNTSGWDFVENIEIFNININHGEGGTARNRIKSELQSQIQGHLHTQLYVDFLVGATFIVFGMQVGCGVDVKSYAMAYGKNYKKPAIGCGVVLNKGTLPIAIPMKMG